MTAYPTLTLHRLLGLYVLALAALLPLGYAAVQEQDWGSLVLFLLGLGLYDHLARHGKEV